jgi:hypothetical protein
MIEAEKRTLMATSGIVGSTPPTSLITTPAVLPAALDFDLKQPATSFSLKRARAFAALSLLTYGDELDAAGVKDQLKKWGFQNNDVQLFGWQDDGGRAFVAGNSDVIVVAFRGTKDPLDLSEDAEAPNPEPDTGVQEDYRLQGRIHRGFQEAIQRVWDQDSNQGGTGLMFALQQMVGRYPNAKVYITGHSLGAAMATIAAGRIPKYESYLPPDARPGTRAKSITVDGVYTYGSPRVGNNEYAAAYNALLVPDSSGVPNALGDITFRCVNLNDAVPQVPPEFMGYKHVGRLVQIASSGIVVDAGPSDVKGGSDINAHMPVNYLSAFNSAQGVIQRPAPQAASYTGGGWLSGPKPS